VDRIIMHVDMDAFFAAVEVLDNPRLKGKPVMVGGTSERGVVATCSYEARKYGVRSAMPVFMAKSKCPEGIFLPSRYWRYKEISNKIFNIFYQITPLVEPLSIDEAYLDITKLNKDPVELASYIKHRIKTEIGLTISVVMLS
jgi:DNA polymerase-4